MLSFAMQTAAAQNPKLTAIIIAFAILLPHYQHLSQKVSSGAISHFPQATKLDTTSFFQRIWGYRFHPDSGLHEVQHGLSYIG